MNSRRIYATGISNGSIFSHYWRSIWRRASPPSPEASPKEAASFHPSDPVSILIYQVNARGFQDLRRFLTGQVCHDIDATQVIWEFFKAHPGPSQPDPAGRTP